MSDRHTPVSKPNELGFDKAPVPPSLPAGWVTETATGARISEAEHIEYEVFRAAGFCESSPLGRVREFEPWRSDSRFKVVLEPDGVLHGTVRYLVGPYHDLPVGSFPAVAGGLADPVLEYASLAVPEHARGTGVSEALYRAVWLEAMRQGVGGVAAIGESWLMQILNDYYDLGFEQLGPSRWYMGGDCFPMGTTLPAVLSRLERQPSFRAWVFSEIDLREMPVGLPPGQVSPSAEHPPAE